MLIVLTVHVLPPSLDFMSPVTPWLLYRVLMSLGSATSRIILVSIQARVAEGTY